MQHFASFNNVCIFQLVGFLVKRLKGSGNGFVCVVAWIIQTNEHELMRSRHAAEINLCFNWTRLNCATLLTFLMCGFADMTPNNQSHSRCGAMLVIVVYNGVWFFKIIFPVRYHQRAIWSKRNVFLWAITAASQLSSFQCIACWADPKIILATKVVLLFKKWHVEGQSHLGAATFYCQTTSTLNRKTENQYPDGNRGALVAALFREADPREEVRRQLEGSYGISMLL